MKRLFFALYALFALSGCVSLPEGSAPATRYDFGLPDGSSGNIAGKIGLEVKTPAGFNSLYVDYRLAYDAALEPREYATSRWAANPGVLLSRRLRERLGFSTAVPDGTLPPCWLRIDLNEFSQIFDAPSESRARLDADVRLYVQGRLLARKRFSVGRKAASPDARGGVEALVGAAGLFSRDLAVWLNAIKTPPSASSDYSTASAPSPEACF
jgi:cholesterol transport system auxiliary component